MEKHVIELSNALAAAGHEVVLLTDPSYAPFIQEGVELIPFNYQRSRYSPRLLFSLLKALRKLDPEIIHCHGSKAAQLVSTLDSALHVPMVATVHGIKKRLKFLRRFDAVIGVSKHITRMLSHTPNAVTIYNGIRTPEIISRSEQARLKQSLSIAPDDFLWVAVGRLAPVKGFDLLLEAMPQVDGHLLLLGDGPERASLEAQAESLGIRPRITFAGHRDDAQRLLQCADQVVISSLREGFSYVFLEAMLTRTPVISTDVPVANEILPPELICKTGSSDALAALMQRVQRSPVDLTGIMTDCAEHMTLDNMARSVQELYRHLLPQDKQQAPHE
ncbi:glycosyltransferase family 4 protein [Marinobacterium maritimum]|uniref:Glycosyltransferase family 4 protein n=2 Tax=Marinobacterium maritimum TaxID=500162 RepID=A0ABP3TFH0_9GAMM